MTLWAEVASGQGHHSGETFVAVRAGANLVGNAYRVRETKPEPGAGASIGSFLSPRWAVEFETWMRASNPECCAPRRTEMLYSVSVVRLLASEGIQPYMLGGLTLLQADHPAAAGADRRRRAVPPLPASRDGHRSSGQRRRIDDDRATLSGADLQLPLTAIPAVPQRRNYATEIKQSREFLLSFLFRSPVCIRL